jgi:hypothetical protein
LLLFCRTVPELGDTAEPESSPQKPAIAAAPCPGPTVVDYRSCPELPLLSGDDPFILLFLRSVNPVSAQSLVVKF